MKRRPDSDEGELDDDPIVRTVRSNARSKFYDPRYAQPIGSSGPVGGWGEVDTSFLEDTRPTVPPFPIEVLPSIWLDWVNDTARAAGASVDFVALSLIAGVAGLCGGVRVRAAQGWSEPLALWQVLLGAPGSGKSPAIASLRAMLTALGREHPPETADAAAAPSGKEAAMELGDVVAVNASSALLWCDEGTDWLACLADASESARARLVRAWSSPTFTSLLISQPPEQLSHLAKLDPAFVSRLLFTWPHAAPYSSLVGRKPAADDVALADLRRIVGAAGTAASPTILTLDAEAVGVLDSFLATLHAGIADAEGLDQAWQAKGRGTVVRLIGCLSMLQGTTGPIGRWTVEQAIVLWRDYLLPHARAVLQLATPDDLNQKARQVVRWLKSRAGSTVSREEIRCEALGRSINAARTDQVLYRLQAAGIVSQVMYATPSQGGRPPNRWEINPRLTTAGNPRNPGNLSRAASAVSPTT